MRSGRHRRCQQPDASRKPSKCSKYVQRTLNMSTMAGAMAGRLARCLLASRGDAVGRAVIASSRCRACSTQLGKGAPSVPCMRTVASATDRHGLAYTGCQQMASGRSNACSQLDKLSAMSAVKGPYDLGSLVTALSRQCPWSGTHGLEDWHHNECPLHGRCCVHADSMYLLCLSSDQMDSASILQDADGAILCSWLACETQVVLQQVTCGLSKRENSSSTLCTTPAAMM